MRKLFSASFAKKEDFPALTGIRAVAAFMVFFSHFNLLIQPHFFITLQNIFYTGVSFFFVLSGFLIFYRYYKECRLSRRWACTFFSNRFARIYPLYFLILTTVILLNKNFNGIYLLQNYTLTHNLFFLFKTYGFAIQPSWSLTVEECFYLLAPLFILITHRYSIAVAFIISFAVYIIFLFTYADGNPFSQKGFLLSIDSFFGRCFEFFTGIFLALKVLKNKRTNDIKHSNKIWTLAGVVGIALAFVLLMYIAGKTGTQKFTGMIIVNNYLLPVPVAMLYYGLIFENSLIKRILSGKFFSLAGKSSYAFYLVHMPLITFIGNPLIAGITGEKYHNLFVLLIFTLSFLVSVLLFLFFEEPLNRWLRKKLNPRVLKTGINHY